MNYQSQLLLRFLAGCYVIYLGYQAFCGMLEGGSDVNPLLGYGLPVLLMAGGLAINILTGKQYLQEKSGRKRPGNRPPPKPTRRHRNENILCI